jgi:hypothetical protein
MNILKIILNVLIMCGVQSVFGLFSELIFSIAFTIDIGKIVYLLSLHFVLETLKWELWECLCITSCV